MKRMKRRLFPKLFPILAAGSLALAIGVAGVWVRSYWTTDVFRFGPSRLEMTTITVAQGSIRWVGPNETTAPLMITHHFWRLEVAFLILSVIFACPWSLQALTHPGALGCLIVLNHAMCLMSDWLAALAVLAMDGTLILWWLHSSIEAQRRSSREAAGYCPECGYDLRAHAPGQVCPECGSAVPADMIRKPMA